MSEHEEFMPLCSDIKNNDCCVKCNKQLNNFRDGTTCSNNQCHNCYWREKNSTTTDKNESVPLICHRCDNTFDWEPGIGNVCNDCTD